MNNIKKILCFLIVILFFTTGCSSKIYEQSQEIKSFLFPVTDGIVIEKDGTITMHSTSDDNIFDCVRLQLYTENPQLYAENPIRYVMDISRSVEGKNSGIYVHKLDTGTYIVALKANSNKKDERIDLRTYLIKGRSYTFFYNVELFEESTVVIKDFKFRMN